MLTCACKVPEVCKSYHINFGPLLEKERNRNIDWAVGRRYEIYQNCLAVNHTEENKQN